VSKKTFGGAERSSPWTWQMSKIPICSWDFGFTYSYYTI